MGVITEDPKEWECHEYHFQLAHERKTYYLSSHNFSVDPFHQGIRYPKTTISTMGSEIYSSPCFIPISTGDDMHEEAQALVHRLLNLVIFS